MTRAEAWLTGIGAVAALLPTAILAIAVNLAILSGSDGLVAPPVFGSLLLAIPGAVALLAMKRHRELRLALTAAAVLMLGGLIVVSLEAAAFLPFALVVLAVSASQTARHLEDVVAAFVRHAEVVVILPVFWLTAVKVLVDGDGLRCRGTAESFWSGEACARGGLDGVSIAVILLLLAVPAVLVTYLRRNTPQHPAQL